MGYVYNRTAATLRSQRSHAIGLIVADIKNPFFAELIVGVEKEFEKAGKVVLLANTSESLSRQKKSIEAMFEHGTDGILICPARGSKKSDLEKLTNSGMPLVLFTRYVKGLKTNYIEGNNVEGSFEAVSHLIGLGHRRIAFIGGVDTASPRWDRERGYRLAHEEAGVPIDPHLNVQTNISIQEGSDAIRELFLRGASEPPTAAFCYNDCIAYGVIFGLNTLGMEAGRDFSVVGFDDGAWSVSWRPPLTTVSTSPEKIGIEAARMLMSAIEHPNAEPRKIYLPAPLVVRQSTCPPPVKPQP
jgi:LacI family transcriptional regulator